MSSETTRRRMAALAIITTVISACGGADPALEPATTVPPVPQAVAADDASSGLAGTVRDPKPYVGDLSLPDPGSGEDFPLVGPDGGLLLLYFGYTSCPDVCPTTLADLRRAVRALGHKGDHIEVAMATIDPDRDSDEVVTAYVQSFFEDGHGLRTDDAEALHSVTSAFRAVFAIDEEEDGTINVAHTADVYVIDDQGLVQVLWPFGTESADMTSDMEILLVTGGSVVAAPATTIADAPQETTTAAEEPTGAVSALSPRANELLDGAFGFSYEDFELAEGISSQTLFQLSSSGRASAVFQEVRKNATEIGLPFEEKQLASMDTLLITVGAGQFSGIGQFDNLIVVVDGAGPDPVGDALEAIDQEVCCGTDF